MRGRLIRVLLVLLVFAGTAGGARAAGDPQVAGLQVALRSHGLYEAEIDGITGPLTQRGVRELQRRAGLSVDGVVGPATRRALGRLGRPLFGKRLLQKARVGWDVSVLQFLLSRRGFSPGQTDGYFGPGTSRAVRLYQEAAGLAVDGIAGPRTMAALAGRAPPTPRARRAQTSQRYVVRPGDTLTGIAARFGTTIQKLVQLNDIDPANVLVIGTKLRVPVRTSAAVVRLIDRWAGRYGINRSLARALAWQESGFLTNLTSSANAWGVMQVTPATWEFVETVLLGKPVPRTTEGNIRVGLAYLRHLLRLFEGDERLAIGAYYQGARAVRERGLIPETQVFVANVLALKARM